jgi:hypothetical protein
MDKDDRKNKEALHPAYKPKADARPLPGAFTASFETEEKENKADGEQR